MKLFPPSPPKIDAHRSKTAARNFSRIAADNSPFLFLQPKEQEKLFLTLFLQIVLRTCFPASRNEYL